MGLNLIGTAGSDEKCALAQANGAAHVINYQREDFVARVKEITGGAGVKAMYDSIGKDTFERSLDCLRPFGLLASFGNASGPVPPFALGLLAAKGSLYVTRATLFTHIATRAATQAMADDLFAVVAGGQVKICIDQRYALSDIAQAHRDPHRHPLGGEERRAKRLVISPGNEVATPAHQIHHVFTIGHGIRLLGGDQTGNTQRSLEEYGMSRQIRCRTRRKHGTSTSHRRPADKLQLRMPVKCGGIEDGGIEAVL